MTDTTLIKNARLVNEGAVSEGDLLIRDGRIDRIDTGISPPDGAVLIDAGGAWLLPGMIDDQVHFREPGLTWKADIGTESRAAAAGGITSFMEMPNTRPATVTLEALEDKYRLGAAKSLLNYGFYLGATNDNLDDIRALPVGAAAGIKIFMGASTGNMLVDNEDTLAGIFRDAPALITTHCESSPMIDANLQAELKRYGPEIPIIEHPNIRSAEACYVSTRLAQELSRTYQAPLHVLHLTTAMEMDLFEPGPVDGKLITGEVCVHHLHFSAHDYPRLGTLQSGRLDIIATDHAPHTQEEKASRNYLDAPAGLPLVQDALLAVLELFHDGILSMEDIVLRAAHNPATRFRVADRGFLREGAWADLVLVDTTAATPVTSDRVLSKCGWSPFEGKTFRSRILRTLVNGQTVFDGEHIVEAGSAQRLQFGPQRDT